MTDGTRAAALSPRGPLGLWVKPQEGGEGARREGARVFWAHGSGPVGYPNFWMCDPAQRSTESSLSVAARTQSAPSDPEGASLAPRLRAYLGFTGRTRRWRRLSSGPAPGARSPWAGSGASRPAGKASYLRALCSARWRSLSPGAAGVL